jgi:hypothetical protein
MSLARLWRGQGNVQQAHEGWALAFVRYSTAYVREEEKAPAAQRGLWRGAFIAPWDWRHRDRGTTILGPLSVPITAQKQLLEPFSAGGAPSHDCIIKGNVNREGERIYHMPGGNSYARINMDVPGKRWFCSDAALKATEQPLLALSSTGQKSNPALGRVKSDDGGSRCTERCVGPGRRLNGRPGRVAKP